MKKYLEKIKQIVRPEKLDPNRPADRKKMIEQAVQRTVREYGEALKKLGAD